MISDFVETLGMSAFVAGTYIEAGIAPALFVLGFALLIIGNAFDGIKIQKFWKKDATGKRRVIKKDRTSVDPATLHTGVLTNKDLDRDIAEQVYPTP